MFLFYPGSKDPKANKAAVLQGKSVEGKASKGEAATVAAVAAKNICMYILQTTAFRKSRSNQRP